MPYANVPYTNVPIDVPANILHANILHGGVPQAYDLTAPRTFNPPSATFDPTGTAAYHPSGPYNPSATYPQSFDRVPTPPGGRPDIDMNSDRGDGASNKSDAGKSDAGSHFSQLTHLSHRSTSDLLRDILENVHGHREEARLGGKEDMRELKETVRDLKETVAAFTKSVSESLESNNSLFRRMADRLMNVEDDRAKLRLETAEVRKDAADVRLSAAEIRVEGRKTRQEFELLERTKSLIDGVASAAAKAAAEVAARAAAEATILAIARAQDVDDVDEDEDEEDGEGDRASLGRTPPPLTSIRLSCSRCGRVLGVVVFSVMFSAWTCSRRRSYGGSLGISILGNVKLVGAVLLQGERFG
ncbi:hypothetical protein LXA43DRAFT_1069229 [Ganoderma leucocontextum]|nr:hypothetical protein LXA43DRAFT_1069229 [Ganoderma leucocontextum]